MTNEIVARGFRFSILIVLLAGGVCCRGQENHGLSPEDRTEIIESVLRHELKAQSSEFEIIRNVSSENMEFIDPSKVSRHGFVLVSVDQIRNLKKDHVVEYVVLRELSLKDGVVVVSLSRVSEGRPCFGPAFFRERSFKYNYRKNSGEWIAELVNRPPLLFSFRRNLSTKQ